MDGTALAGWQTKRLRSFRRGEDIEAAIEGDFRSVVGHDVAGMDTACFAFLSAVSCRTALGFEARPISRQPDSSPPA